MMNERDNHPQLLVTAITLAFWRFGLALCRLSAANERPTFTLVLN
jgi:hypothetical protein